MSTQTGSWIIVLLVAIAIVGFILFTACNAPELADAEAQMWNGKANFEDAITRQSHQASVDFRHDLMTFSVVMQATGWTQTVQVAVLIVLGVLIGGGIVVFIGERHG